MEANINTFQQTYTDFGQGKVPAIRERVDPDVAWVSAGPAAVPYARGHRSLHEVGDSFNALAATVDARSFGTKELFARGDRFVLLGTLPGHAKTTGQTSASVWTMAGTLRRGKVKSFRACEDTHTIAAAFGA